jgi:hypothetical protein
MAEKPTGEPNSTSIALVENDINGDDLCVWCFPQVSALLQSVIIKRCSSEGQQSPFIFLKVKNDWIYILKTPTKKEISPDLVSCSIAIISRVFNPEKFRNLSKIYIEQYVSTGDPTKILEGHLSIHINKKFTNKIGTYDSLSYNDTDALIKESSLKELSNMLGVEMVVLWNAILLKKRILVVGDNIDILLNVVRTLPQLAWHRKDWSILRPLVSSDQEHIDDLTHCGVFIAGTMDNTLAMKNDLYDVVLSLTERRVTITTHAMGSMKMCSLHKEIAKIISEKAESSSNNDIIEAVSIKTNSILNNLKSISTDGEKITEIDINERVSNTAAQQWLVRLATAEGLL